MIFQGAIIPVGNSPEGNPTGGNLLDGNLPTGNFLGLYFSGGKYYTGGNTLQEKSSRRQFTGGQFSRGELLQRAILWEAVFKKFFFGGGAILYRETNPEGSLLRGNLLEAGQIFSGCNSLFTLFLLI